MTARTRKAAVPAANFSAPIKPSEAAMAATKGGTVPAGLVVDPFAGALTVLPTASMPNGAGRKPKTLPPSLAQLVAELVKREDHVVVIARGAMDDDTVKQMKSILRSNRDKFAGYNIRITEGTAEPYGPAIRFALHPQTNGK